MNDGKAYQMTRLPSWRIAATAIIAVVLVIFAVAYAAARASSAEPAPSHVVSLSSSGRASATLDVTAGMPVLNIRTADLGDTLLRVATPDDAPVRPVLSEPAGSEPGTRAAPIGVSLASAQEDEGHHDKSPPYPGSLGYPAPPAPPAHGRSDDADQSRGSSYTVSVVLNSDVVWSLNLAGGTSRTVADLRGGQVASISVTAGSDIIDLALPAPDKAPGDHPRTVPLRLAGGASQFTVTVPAGVPARLLVGGGAAQVTVGAQDWTGVSAGTLITPPGWASANPRYDIVATAGVSRLTIGTR